MTTVQGTKSFNSYQINEFQDQNHNQWADPEEPVQVQTTSTSTTPAGRNVIETSEFTVSAKDFCLAKTFQGFGSPLTRFTQLQGSVWKVPYGTAFHLLLFGETALQPTGLHKLSLIRDYQDSSPLKFGRQVSDDEGWIREYNSTLALATSSRTLENREYEYIQGVDRLKKIGKSIGLDPIAWNLIGMELEDTFILAVEGRKFDQRAYALGELLASGEPKAFDALQELLGIYEKKCEYLLVFDEEKKAAIERVQEQFFKGFAANPLHRDYLKNTPLDAFPRGFLNEEALRIWKATLGD